jgi:hypothetical protein
MIILLEQLMAWWSRMYKDVLNDLRESALVISTDASLSDGQKANQLAMVDIMQVYTYDIVVKNIWRCTLFRCVR